jgi:hypothetical protein
MSPGHEATNDPHPCRYGQRSNPFENCQSVNVVWFSRIYLYLMIPTPRSVNGLKLLANTDAAASQEERINVTAISPMTTP